LRRRALFIKSASIDSFDQDDSIYWNGR